MTESIISALEESLDIHTCPHCQGVEFRVTTQYQSDVHMVGGQVKDPLDSWPTIVKVVCSKCGCVLYKEGE